MEERLTGTRYSRAAGGERGITLIEMLTVVAIVAILCMVLGFSFSGWVARHKVESEARQLFTDVIEARGRAMQRNRATFVVLSGSGYSTYEDTAPAPDGDGTLNTAADNLRTTKWYATCGSCHTWGDAMAHMEGFGGGAGMTQSQINAVNGMQPAPAAPQMR